MADRILSPQQEIFFAAYIDPKSPTFNNACQSALKAGYSQQYAENITGQMPDWLSESLGDRNLVQKAEKNLNKLLESDKEDIQLNTSKFVLERLNKKKYAQRQEHTGEDGAPLTVKIVDSYGDNPPA